MCGVADGCAHVMAMDFNGDGRSDVLVIQADGNHALFESMGTGGVYLTSVIIAVLIPFIQTLFSRLAVGLTDNVRNRSSLSFQTEALLY